MPDDPRERAIEAALLAWFFDDHDHAAQPFYLERMRVAIAAYEQAVWAPIEAAPKDGTQIDLWMSLPASPTNWADDFRISDCWWQDGQWVHYYRGAVTPLRGELVTHWRPLPAPPEADEPR